MTRQDVPPLKEVFILNQLEELAEKLGIAVRYENVIVEESSGTGGLCRIKGKYVLIVHSHATSKEKIQVMAAALKVFDLGDIYVKPVIRELLEGSVE
jgi:N-dimethylarginine dimethylaminohydrolase